MVEAGEPVKSDEPIPSGGHVPALAAIGGLATAIAAALTSDAVPSFAAGLATVALAVSLVALVLWFTRRN